jgi:hypothetical protein
VNSVGAHGMGPLLTFIPSVVEYLLSKGADPNRQTNECGDPVLIGIACYNNVECVRLLLQARADPKAVVQDTGETALHCCVIWLGNNVSASGSQAARRSRRRAESAHDSRRADRGVLAGCPHPRRNTVTPRSGLRVRGNSRVSSKCGGRTKRFETPTVIHPKAGPVGTGERGD